MDDHFDDAARTWLNNLANVTAPGAEPVSAERIITMAMLLAGDGLPAAVFCGDSLRALAKTMKFFPTYGEVSVALATWWGRNRPILPALMHDPAFAALSRGERHWVESWQVRRAEILSPGYRPVRGSIEQDLQCWLSLMRQESPAAHAFVQGGAPAGVTAPEPHVALPDLSVVFGQLRFGMEGEAGPTEVREKVRAARRREVDEADEPMAGRTVWMDRGQ